MVICARSRGPKLARKALTSTFRRADEVARIKRQVSIELAPTHESVMCSDSSLRDAFVFGCHRVILTLLRWWHMRR